MGFDGRDQPLPPLLQSRQSLAGPALAASILGLGLTGCGPKTSAAAAPPPVEVGVVTVSAGPVPMSIELTGRVAAAISSDVRPQVGGIVQARRFTEGSLVRAGQALYEIDPRLYRAALDTARAQLENAQAGYAAARSKADRYRLLGESDSVSRQDYDDTLAAAQAALAAVHQYQAAVETARVNLDYASVRAPITGRIGRSTVTPGALVMAGQTAPLATIQQLDPVYVDIPQSTSQLLRVRQALARGDALPASATVRLKMEDGADYPQAGTIEFSEVTVNGQTDTVMLRARFPNPKGVLLPGMFVRVQAPQAVLPKAVLAPQQGVVRDPKGGARALIVGPDDKVVQRSLVTRQAVGDQWLVTQGLSDGDRLIVEGGDKATTGAKVKPVNVRLAD
jgi:membrane fusion protein (multidrug efflux system)